MLLVITRKNEVEKYIDSVLEFDSEAELDKWLARFDQVREPDQFEFLAIAKTTPPALPSYDDPDSLWTRSDYVRLVKRILNSRILCWHCHSPNLDILSDGWVCGNCGQNGRYTEAMNDEEAAMFNNSPFRELALPNAAKSWEFCHPYVCVVHNPSGIGYYLDRRYNLIGSVHDIVIPGTVDPELPFTLTRCVPHETEVAHQASSFTTPEWAKKGPMKDFTTYWLY